MIEVALIYSSQENYFRRFVIKIYRKISIHFNNTVTLDLLCLPVFLVLFSAVLLLEATDLKVIE